MKAIYDLPAPAKLNLFLHVVGRRADGHHLLQSLFVLIDWCDTLHVEWRGDGLLARHDLGMPLPADDLCLRAARALQAEAGTSLGADLSIDKRLPSGAGMGGGSSDAATVLLALNRLWGLHWPLSRLAPIALAIGADVPFFLGGRNAFVEGIGERLTPGRGRRRFPPGGAALWSGAAGRGAPGGWCRGGGPRPSTPPHRSRHAPSSPTRRSSATRPRLYFRAFQPGMVPRGRCSRQVGVATTCNRWPRCSAPR